MRGPSHSGARFLRSLSSANLTSFTVQEANHVHPLHRTALLMLLSRLTREGWVVRMRRGEYAVRVMLPEPQEAALPWGTRARLALMHGPDEYISVSTALDQHGVLLRPVVSIFVCSPRRLRPGRHPDVVFVTHKCMGDPHIVDLHGLRVAALEQAIADCMRRPALVKFSDVAQALWHGRDQLNRDALNSLLTRETSATRRRLGYMCETLGIRHRFLDAWRQGRNASAPKLVPGLEPRGSFVSGWRLYDNDPEVFAWRNA